MLHFFPEVAFISHRKEAAVKMKAYDVCVMLTRKQFV